MHVVVDASLLAGALLDAEGPIGRRYRRRLTELVSDDQAYVMRTLTKLEVAAALRNQLRRAGRDGGGSGSVTADDCERVIKGMVGWPFARIELTQPMLVRIWELRGNITPYDAMYVAATEQLLAEHSGQAVLARALIGALSQFPASVNSTGAPSMKTAANFVRRPTALQPVSGCRSAGFKNGMARTGMNAMIASRRRVRAYPTASAYDPCHAAEYV